MVEILLFDSEGGNGTIEATARGLLEDVDVGETTNRDANSDQRVAPPPRTTRTAPASL